MESSQIILRKILVVEDDDAHAFLAKYVIKGAFKCVEIQHAWNGQEAIDYLSGIIKSGEFSALPDLIMLDINMPKVDGFGVLKYLKEHEKLSGVSAVMLSSSNLESDMKRASDLGASGFLVKPLEEELLRSVIFKIGFKVD